MSGNVAKWIYCSDKQEQFNLQQTENVIKTILLITHKFQFIESSIAFGNVKGLTLCYENMFYDLVGDANDEVKEISTVPGKLSVSKQFWLQYVSSIKNIPIQKKFIDGGNTVLLWE
ncbi:Hypothetical_protein [Hexamita inflata]|uniref:Hypothetical_protein n=1 Tax=Hexamita inflata TaxID=28002 RepID=A0AA86QE45_9EUKA|nr:Hypothetical protein HINF_LOCUS44023 [Hexamita inflata]